MVNRYVYLNEDHISVCVWDRKIKETILMSHDEWRIKKREKLQ